MSTPIQPLPWNDAVRDTDSAERARFLESHVDLVKYIAIRVLARLPASVELDDLIHDGIVGLVDAVDRFDSSRSVRFRTYAETRIRGAIFDGLRQKDWRPRSLRQMKRNLDSAANRLSTMHGRPATEEEIAGEMGIGLDEYRTVLKDLNVGSLLSLDDLPPGIDPTPQTRSRLQQPALEKAEMLELLAEELDEIPERERRVLELYYAEELNMKEVGAVLGVTESRVCQLHGQAAARLRGALSRRLQAPAMAASGSSGRN